MSGPENLGSNEMHPADSAMERAGTAPEYTPPTEEISTQSTETAEPITNTPEEPILSEQIIKSAESLRSKIRKLQDQYPNSQDLKAIRRNLRRIATGKVTDEKEAKKMIAEAKKIIDQYLVSDYINQGLTVAGEATGIPLSKEQIKTAKEKQAAQEIGHYINQGLTTTGEAIGVPLSKTQIEKAQKEQALQETGKYINEGLAATGDALGIPLSKEQIEKAKAEKRNNLPTNLKALKP